MHPAQSNDCIPTRNDGKNNGKQTRAIGLLQVCLFCVLFYVILTLPPLELFTGAGTGDGMGSAFAGTLQQHVDITRRKEFHAQISQGIRSLDELIRCDPDNAEMYKKQRIALLQRQVHPLACMSTCTNPLACMSISRYKL